MQEIEQTNLLVFRGGEELGIEAFLTFSSLENEREIERERNTERVA